MFSLLRVLSSADYSSDETSALLDTHFHPELVTNGGKWVDGKPLSLDEALQYWGDGFAKHLPQEKHEQLRYLCNGTTAFSSQNHVGRACQRFVWPAFFKAFPEGKILILELKEKWSKEICRGQIEHAHEVCYEKENPAGILPQEMTGLLADDFPLNVLHIAAFGIYPLILLDFVHTSANLSFVYVPDLAMSHSQMTELGAFRHILWRLHHVYDDQWTFDGSRGPKSATPPKRIRPHQNIDFVTWTISLISHRMSDILGIADVIRRQQLAMTFSRAAYDAILAVSFQLPYISKVFFFACLDKLANMLFETNGFSSETEAWRHIVNCDFLEQELACFLQKAPGAAGEDLRSTVRWASEYFRTDNITPEVLRDLRNSHHGYNLRADTVERLYRHSGELNNDTTLIATPLVLYVLSRPWSKTGNQSSAPCC